ncbi:MAG: hypothetical protein Q9M18_09380 [Mariprofundaceae bacterium]|nr:hypothetical protein [Mariprofundaceae bacterium]
MDVWLHIVIQQMTLYMLPIIISMTVVCWLEQYVCHQNIPHPFYAIAWKGTWLPFLISIAFTRGVIICLARPLSQGLFAAWIRFCGHAALTLLGFLLYSWCLHHQAASGLPPIHQWWAKVLMFFNLCMLATHLLPLPNVLMGEWLIRQPFFKPTFKLYTQYLTEKRALWLFVLLAASPLLDALLGVWLIYPVYGELATWATTF